MARILIAWEPGEGFGHLARCLRAAERLKPPRVARHYAPESQDMPPACPH